MIKSWFIYAIVFIVLYGCGVKKPPQPPAGSGLSPQDSQEEKKK